VVRGLGLWETSLGLKMKHGGYRLNLSHFCAAAVILASTFLGGCHDSDTLQRTCLRGSPCYIDAEGNVIESPDMTMRGICHYGELDCQGDDLFCLNYQAPEEEVCDGLDNDCNGATDEVFSYTVGDSCYYEEGSIVVGSRDLYGICQNGIIACSADGGIDCFGHVEPQLEICDELDNDCDGLADNNLTDTQEGSCPPIAGPGGADCLPPDPVCRSGQYECPDQDALGMEVCDGIDNDCDGLIDENTEEYPLFSDPFVYEGPMNTVNIGPCQIGLKECIDGIEIVVGMVVPEPEACNFIDDDCDGEVDESDTGGPLYSPGTYTGPPGTEGVGICSPSMYVCEDGDMTELSESLPRQENCENFIDDDCDGLIDESDGELTPQSFFIVIDVSGSMRQYLDPLARALCNWSTTNLLAQSKFALGYGGGIGSWGHSGATTSIGIIHDFTDAATICDIMTDDQGDFSLGVYGGGSEYMPEAMMLGHSSSELTWPTGLNKQILVFSDEPVQATSSVSMIIEDLKSDCNTYNYQVGIFASEHANDWSSWEPIIDPNEPNSCEGFMYPLETDSQLMVEYLNEAFLGNCH
jgi:hypothetical protein